ncbi:uncharacterized protein LOC107981666 [Nasonia vitripennis]|uniref:Uncharacterized protein n=1 Tax=Nasonia vitripennis TaxID=7425 RepID=A0A7M7IT98_NASVI|nr:uncharacterized protein LOC107981666 [Nasonia vitripennis]
MKQDIARFDTSDYPKDNKFGMPHQNKKVLGVMKDECAGNVMVEFLGLRSKMYCVRIDGQDPIKKAKGVKGTVVKNKMDCKDYHRCLFDREILVRQQQNIRSRRHVVTTEKQEKVALSPHDNKRHLVIGETDTLPWGHYSLRTCEAALAEGAKICPCNEEEPASKRPRLI